MAQLHCAEVEDEEEHANPRQRKVIVERRALLSRVLSMHLCISTRILMQQANATSSCKHSSCIPSDHAALATFTCSSRYLAWSFMRAIDDDF